MHRTVTLVKFIEAGAPMAGSMVYTWTYTSLLSAAVAEFRAYKALKRDRPDEDASLWKVRA